MGKWHKVFLTSFAEVTLAEAFLGSKSVNPLATAPLTWQKSLTALAVEGLGFRSETCYEMCKFPALPQASREA